MKSLIFASTAFFTHLVSAFPVTIGDFVEFPIAEDEDTSSSG